MTEEEFERIAETLRPYVERDMKIEVAPWIKEYVSEMEDLYTELVLQKLHNKPYGPVRETLDSYREIFGTKGTSDEGRAALGSPSNLLGRKILMKGDPGIGKSTLVKKISWDLAKKHFTAVSVVIFVFLKLVSPDETIEDIIVRQMPVLQGLNIKATHLRTILEKHGPKCLLILDGLDEHAKGKNKDVMRIIKGQKHLFCNVIVTSRPHSTGDIEKYFDTVASVEGFTWSNARKFASCIVPVKEKVDRIMEFTPAGMEERLRLQNIPIILSFLCLLVREDQLDFSNKAVHTGDIYARMIRCLYRKYTIRKGIAFENGTFISVIRSLGKLALRTLLSGDPLLKRSEVIAEVGEEAFDYGLLIGNEDAYRLLQNETADIFLTYPHRSLQEFLGAFYFILMLSEGRSIGSLIGDACQEPIFLRNPLFLHFCLWVLITSDEVFAVKEKENVRKALVAFTVTQIDNSHLDLRSHLPVVLEDTLENISGDKLLVGFLEDVLSSCERTESLVLRPQHPVDWVLSVMKSRMRRLKSVVIQPFAVVHPSKDIEPWAEGNRAIADVSRKRKCKETDLDVVIDDVEDKEILDTVIKHCKNSKRLSCLHLRRQFDKLELLTLLQDDISGIDLDCGRRSAMAVCSNEMPICPFLSRLSFRSHAFDRDLFTVLRHAIQDGHLPKLRHVSFPDCSFPTKDILHPLFQSLNNTLTHLDFCDTELSESDIQFLTEVKTVSSLVLSSKSIASEVAASDIFQHRWIRLTSLTLGNVDARLNTAFVRTVNGSKFPNLTELRISAKYKAHEETEPDQQFPGESDVNLNGLDPHKLPHLESLTLFRMINTPLEFGTLAQKMRTWKLTNLDISHSTGIRGFLSTCFVQRFPFLQNLILHNSQLNCEDVQSLAAAKVQDKIPKLQYLDISYIGVQNPLTSLKCDPHTLDEVSWGGLKVRTRFFGNVRKSVIVGHIQFEDHVL